MPQLKNRQADLLREYPDGIPEKDMSYLASDMKMGITTGDKQDQFDQKEWDKVVKDADISGAGSRTPLGMAARANLNADRAIVTLTKPMVTYQEAGNVMSDIAAIYQGGSPTNTGLSHQEYTTIYGKLMNSLQSLTGKPQDALPNDIKARLLQDLHEMKATNQKVVKQRLDYTERAKPNLIKSHSNEWKQMRSTFESDQSGDGNSSAPPIYATNGKERIMSTDGGQTWQAAK